MHRSTLQRRFRDQGDGAKYFYRLLNNNAILRTRTRPHDAKGQPKSFFGGTAVCGVRRSSRNVSYVLR